MRISTFVPAVLALTFFSASQAHVVNTGSLVKALVGVHTTAAVDICAKVALDICADIELKATLDASLLGIVHIGLDSKLLVSAKAKLRAEVDAEVRAEVDVIVKAEVLDLIPGVVEHCITKVCKTSDSTCISKNAVKIATDINAKIDVLIAKVFVHIHAKVNAHIRLRLKVIVDKVCVNLGIAQASLKVYLRIASDTYLKVHVKACIKIWAAVCIRLKLTLDHLVVLLRAL